MVTTSAVRLGVAAVFVVGFVGGSDVVVVEKILRHV